MKTSRLSLALESGQITLPPEGQIAIFAPKSLEDLAGLPKDRLVVITAQKPEFDDFGTSGYQTTLAPEGHFSAAIVRLGRAKQETRAMLAKAAAFSPLVIVDGQKTDGVDSILKECKKRASLAGSFSKSHGKLFWFETSKDAFSDWAEGAPLQIADGFVTRPGVFSADGIDPASKALIDALPAKLGRQVADLGAGWGYLSKDILSRADVERLYLVEANHTALDCARDNIDDTRAAFHWADVTRWDPPARMNSVVMNPPFHSGRAADPELGRAFIAAAARMLAPSGQLWMVANRHLPYETTLETLFGKVQEAAGDNRFKILHAQRPTRAKR